MERSEIRGAANTGCIVPEIALRFMRAMADNHGHDKSR